MAEMPHASLPHWQLAQSQEDYYWSSAKYYQTGEDHFGFITDYRERL
jgi:hypothetical protein